MYIEKKINLKKTNITCLLYYQNRIKMNGFAYMVKKIAVVLPAKAS